MGRGFVAVWTCGRVHECGPTSIGTRLFILNFLPVLPLGSVLVLREHDDRTTDVVNIGLHFKSLLHLYIRWLAPWVVLAGILFGGFLDSNSLGQVLGDAEKLVWLAGVVGAVVLWVLSMFFLGGLSPTQRAQQIVYSDFARYPVDVALFGKHREALRDGLRAHVYARLAAFAQAGYANPRAAPDAPWIAAALDPRVYDTSFVNAAFTLARLEWSLARGPARRAFAAAHEALWQRVVALDPGVMRREPPFPEPMPEEHGIPTQYARPFAGGIPPQQQPVYDPWAAHHQAAHGGYPTAPNNAYGGQQPHGAPPGAPWGHGGGERGGPPPG